MHRTHALDKTMIFKDLEESLGHFFLQPKPGNGKNQHKKILKTNVKTKTIYINKKGNK